METEVYTYPNPWASFVMQKRCNTYNIISLAREREINVEIAMIPVRLATLSFAKKLCQALRTQVFISFFLKIMLLLLVPIGSLVFFKIRLSIVKNFSSFDKGVYSPLSSQPDAEEIYINTRALLLEQKIARWLFGKLSTIQWQDCSPSLVRPVSGFIWRG